MMDYNRIYNSWMVEGSDSLATGGISILIFAISSVGIIVIFAPTDTGIRNSANSATKIFSFKPHFIGGISLIVARSTVGMINSLDNPDGIKAVRIKTNTTNSIK